MMDSRRTMQKCIKFQINLESQHAESVGRNIGTHVELEVGLFLDLIDFNLKIFFLLWWATNKIDRGTGGTDAWEHNV